MESSYTYKSVPKSFLNQILDYFLLFCYVFYAYAKLIYRYVFRRPLKSLDGEVFLITGAASGIGREVVYNLAKNHPKTVLVLWDRNDEANRQLCEDVKILGVKAFCYTIDVTDFDLVQDCAKQVVKDVGSGVSVLFQNAGILNFGDFMSQHPKTIEKTMAVNVLSHFWTLKAFLPEMIKQNKGHVVTTCSLAGHVAAPFDASYCASKFAVRGYLESLKAELRLHPLQPKIQFTTVYPTVVKTPLSNQVELKLKMRDLFEDFLILEPEFVAAAIIEGVRRNEENVFLPKISEFVVLCRNVAPAALNNRIADSLIDSIRFNHN